MVVGAAMVVVVGATVAVVVVLSSGFWDAPAIELPPAETTRLDATAMVPNVDANAPPTHSGLDHRVPWPRSLII